MPVSFLSQGFTHVTPEEVSQVAAEFLRALSECKPDLTEKEMMDLLGKFFKNPENRTEAYLSGFVADKKLSYLFPTTRAKNQIESFLKEGAAVDTIVAWIEKNTSGVRFDIHFARLVMRIVLIDSWNHAKNALNITDTHIKTTPGKHDEPIGEEMKDHIKKYGKVLQLILKDSLDAQVGCLYEIQKQAHVLDLPKTVVNTVFVCLYDQDVILEEAIFAWRDDSKDQSPGKTQAMFAVSKWLAWLQEREEEEEEEEGEGGGGGGGEEEEDEPRSS